MKSFINSLTVSIALAFCGQAKAASGWQYFETCLIGGGTGVAGVGAATAVNKDKLTMNTTGYAIGLGLGCLAGMAFVGIVSDTSKFDAESTLRVQNDKLKALNQMNGYSLCLRRGNCNIKGNAQIEEQPPQVIKQGDQVTTHQNSKIIPRYESPVGN